MPAGAAVVLVASTAAAGSGPNLLEVHRIPVLITGGGTRLRSGRIEGEHLGPEAAAGAAEERPGRQRGPAEPVTDLAGAITLGREDHRFALERADARQGTAQDERVAFAAE